MARAIAARRYAMRAKVSRGCIISDSWEWEWGVES
jgi:hypothetical protein